MVHSLPADEKSGSNLGAASSRSSADVEQFSGLKISDRQLRSSKWSDLMRGKRYVPFDRVSTVESLAEDSKDCVLIGVLYEKSLQKTGSKGNPYVHWSLTDLKSPQPSLLTLFLYGQAYETWEKDVEAPIRTGSIVAILNPVLLPSRGDGDRDRRSMRVSYGTQIVRLGICPSLGFCTCNKKDGLKCSMPCDRDRGPLVCYYHTLQQAAQKTKQWNNHGSTDCGNGCRSGSDGIFILQPKAHPVPKASHIGFGASTTPSAQPRIAPGQLPASSLTAARNAAKAAGGIDEMTKRLLSSAGACPPKAAAAKIGAPQQVAKAFTEKSDGRLLATPARVPVESERSSHTGSANRAAPVAESDNCASAARRLQMQHPQGIPEPDPNNPLKNIGLDPSPKGAVRSSARPHGATLLAAASRATMPTSQRRRWEQPQAQVQASEAPKIVLSASGAVAPNCSIERAKQSTARSASAEYKRNVKEYGTKVAAQLNVADPRKDLVRHQQSRFASVIEEEKIAKRHRHLAELEAQDAMAEKMEAITEISVQAWKCAECATTTESHKAKGICEDQGHSVTSVTAKKTRWECKSCSLDVFVLDRELPLQCGRCNGLAFKQGPLRRVAKARMEKELLLPRGEELPFLNSIPNSLFSTACRYKRFKEATDDYATM